MGHLCLLCESSVAGFANVVCVVFKPTWIQSFGINIHLITLSLDLQDWVLVPNVDTNDSALIWSEDSLQRAHTSKRKLMLNLGCKKWKTCNKKHLKAPSEGILSSDHCPELSAHDVPSFICSYWKYKIPYCHLEAQQVHLAAVPWMISKVVYHSPLTCLCNSQDQLSTLSCKRNLHIQCMFKCFLKNMYRIRL